ncbi:hypothetical protein B0H13DRAFT_2167485 [Mycena leptocephala]|nr:hypothetical protein B0H13DRAFT_2167485 [Mycena leptocephala]
MSRSPRPLYRLAFTLSLAHITSGLATIFVYDVEGARDSLFAIPYALNTLYIVYMLIPHTVQKDTDAGSRLNKQFFFINFLLLCWVLAVGMVPLTFGAGIMRTLHSCANVKFTSTKCLTVGLDMAVPFALIATRASYLVLFPRSVDAWGRSRGTSTRTRAPSRPCHNSNSCTPRSSNFLRACYEVSAPLLYPRRRCNLGLSRTQDGFLRTAIHVHFIDVIFAFTLACTYSL